MKVPYSNLLILKPERLHTPLSLFIIGFGLLLNLFFIAQLNAIPSVVISRASQRTDPSKKVDIYYNIVHNQPVAVSVYASQDNGITWNIPINLVSGDVGSNIYPGNGKHIVWDVLAEHPNIIYDNVKFKIVADDGIGFNDDFSVFHPIKYHVEGNSYHDAVSQSFVITPAVNWNRGRIYCLTQYDFSNFDMSFDFRIGGGSGADGFVFGWVPDFSYPPTFGGYMDFHQTNGYAVEFDVHPNPWDNSEEHIAVIWNTPENHLARFTLPYNAIENNAWHNSRIVVNNGEIRVYLDGSLKIQYVIGGFQPYTGYWGFTAATGDQNQLHAIDNIVFSTITTR